MPFGMTHISSCEPVMCRARMLNECNALIQCDATPRSTSFSFRRLQVGHAITHMQGAANASRPGASKYSRLQGLLFLTFLLAMSGICVE